MFLLKIGIVVALVIAVLPANEQQQARLYDRGGAGRRQGGVCAWRPTGREGSFQVSAHTQGI